MMRLYLGAAFWLAALAGAIVALLAHRDAPALEPARRLARYATRAAVTFTVALPESVPVKEYTPVLVRDEEQFLRRIGAVRRVTPQSGGTLLAVEVFPEDVPLFRSGVQATYFTVPGTAAWIVQTLIPEERRSDIRAQWSAFYAAEREAIIADLWPAVREAVQEVLAFYEREVPRVLDAHRAEIDALARRHRHGAFERALMPAVRDVAWERAQVDFAPLLDQIGRELWERLPVWGLGWRFVYQSVPFTEDDHVVRRFNEFLERDALPILQDRSAEIVRIVTGIFQETVGDPRVADALKQTFAEVADDPEMLRLARELAAELLLQNDRLRDLVHRRWEEKGLKAAVAAAGNRFEPFIRAAANSIVLADDRVTMNPRLAQVLRSRVLRKDGAWLLLEPGAGPALTDGARCDGRIDDLR